MLFSILISILSMPLLCIKFPSELTLNKANKDDKPILFLLGLIYLHRQTVKANTLRNCKYNFPGIKYSQKNLISCLHFKTFQLNDFFSSSNFLEVYFMLKWSLPEKDKKFLRCIFLFSCDCVCVICKSHYLIHDMVGQYTFFTGFQQYFIFILLQAAGDR